MNAVITGGSKGIGHAISEALLGEGYDIAICARGEEELNQVKQTWSEKYPSRQIFIMPVDVTKRKELEAFASYVKTSFNEIHVLVNNAGSFEPGEVLEEEEGVLDRMLQVNLMSAYHLTRMLAPEMIEKKQGHIFNMCSIASLIAYPNGGSYSISKFALLGFSKVLREELKSKGIKVTSILPGATWSDSWKGANLPQSRLMHARDIAIAVVQALSMSASAVVEEILIRPQLGDL